MLSGTLSSCLENLCLFSLKKLTDFEVMALRARRQMMLIPDATSRSIILHSYLWYVDRALCLQCNQKLILFWFTTTTRPSTLYS